jgi:predicted dehydrogenase
MTLDRRDFLRTTAATTATLTALSASRAAGANDRITLAVMGLHGRGKELIKAFLPIENIEIAYLCDPDSNVLPAAVKLVEDKKKSTPKTEKDIRKVLQDKSVDAIVVAAPDHWHALATIWGCQAGKHVYVEKPCSHNLVEGRRMVEAARKYRRVVQVGTQRRSGPHYQSAADFVRSGKLGKIPFVRTWIAGNRKSIGHKKDAPVPAGVDYNLWLGAAPERPFNPNRFHYNWHWNWDYGTGELGNNGIHALDLARMLMDLDAPLRITAGGGKFFYDDDQQTPDTQIVTYDFPTCSVIWEHRIWSKTGVGGQAWGVMVYGEKGTLVFDRKGWHVEDGIQASDKAGGMMEQHARNFLTCIRDGKRPNADIEEGHKSTRLCHLGNIAFRTGRAIRFDAKTETIPGDKEAAGLLGRSYRAPFVVPDKV